MILVIDIEVVGPGYGGASVAYMLSAGIFLVIEDGGLACYIVFVRNHHRLPCLIPSVNYISDS